MATSLEQLPIEHLGHIVRLLDPIELISISQTSSRMRTFVKPSRAHFVERLLARELLPELGGPTYPFPSTTSVVDPE